MRLHLCLIIVLMLSLCSCEQKSEEPIDNDISFDEVCNKLDSVLSKGMPTLTSDIENFARTLPGYEKIEEKEGTAYIYFTNEQKYFIDLTGATQVNMGLDDEIDDDALIDSIDSLTGYTEPAQDIETNSIKSAYSPSRASGNNTSVSLMTKRNILLWSPMQLKGDGFLNQFNKLENSLKQKFPDLTVTKVYENGKQTASTILNTIELFSKYSLVFIACHSTPDGEIVVPRYPYLKDYNLVKGYARNFENDKDEPVYVLDKKWISEKLPATLKRTVIWTCMCFAASDNAVFRDLCSKRDVADFYGGSQSVNAKTSLGFFRIFITNWFYGRGSDVALNSLRKPTPYNFLNLDNKNVTGNWVPLSSGYHALYYGKISPQKASNGPRVRAVVGKDWLRQNFNNSSSRAMDSNLMGIELTDEETGNTSKLYFNASNVHSVSDNLSKDEQIANVVFEMNTDNLAPGSYKYRSFVDVPEENTSIISDKYESLVIEDYGLTNPIRIYTRDDLVEFIKSFYTSSSRFDNRDVLLMNDIDLGELVIKTTPDEKLKSFNNIFEGNGHTIYRTYRHTYEYNNFLVPSLGNDGILRNFTLNISAPDLRCPQAFRDVVVEYNSGIIDNCDIEINAIINHDKNENWQYIEWLYGYTNYGIIKNCDVRGTINGASTGGLICYWNGLFTSTSTGFRHQEGKIINCKVDVNVDTPASFCGITSTNSGLIDSCYVSGTMNLHAYIGIASSNHEYRAGWYMPTIRNCTSRSIVKASYTASGICSYNSGQIENCTNYTSLATSTQCCGIALHNASSSISQVPRITGCKNYGNMSGLSSIGGIACLSRSFEDDHEGIIENCINYGTITYHPTYNYEEIHPNYPNNPDSWPKFSQISPYCIKINNTKAGKVILKDGYQMKEI